MSDPINDAAPPSLPAQIIEALAGVPKALVPSSVKALDRLVGAAVDIPVAWLAQKKASIDAQTAAFKQVEAAIADAASVQAGGNREIIEKAVNQLVRKSYRQQTNKEAVAAAMVEELEKSAGRDGSNEVIDPNITDVDDDWLNIFERYAEDASSERMQKLWGRVLHGEIRKPGRYSMRTLRFLSEFSQADALAFTEIASMAFTDFIPKELAKPETKDDIRELIALEAAGLIHGASSSGLSLSITLNETGKGALREGDYAIMFIGTPGVRMSWEVYTLSPLGQELLTLIPDRDQLAAARRVAAAMKIPEIKAAYVGKQDSDGSTSSMEVIWQEDEENTIQQNGNTSAISEAN